MGTMERHSQIKTIILETIIYQLGLGIYKQFPIKNEPVILEYFVVESIKNARTKTPEFHVNHLHLVGV